MTSRLLGCLVGLALGWIAGPVLVQAQAPAAIYQNELGASLCTWDQPASPTVTTAAQAQALTYTATDGGVAASQVAVPAVCSGPGQTVNSFACHAPLPFISVGTHTVQLTATDPNASGPPNAPLLFAPYDVRAGNKPVQPPSPVNGHITRGGVILAAVLGGVAFALAFLFGHHG